MKLYQNKTKKKRRPLVHLNPYPYVYVNKTEDKIRFFEEPCLVILNFSFVLVGLMSPIYIRTISFVVWYKDRGVVGRVTTLGTVYDLFTHNLLTRILRCFYGVQSYSHSPLRCHERPLRYTH